MAGKPKRKIAAYVSIKTSQGKGAVARTFYGIKPADLLRDLEELARQKYPGWDQPYESIASVP